MLDSVGERLSRVESCIPFLVAVKKGLEELPTDNFATDPCIAIKNVDSAIIILRGIIRDMKREAGKP